MTTDLTKHSTSTELSFSEMDKAAEMIATGGLFPQWDSKAKVMTLMLLCKAEGCDPLTAVQRYDNIQGRLAKKPQAMLSDFIREGGRVEWVSSTDQSAKAKFTAPDGNTHIEEFTMQDAQRAGLSTKDNWRKYPKSMLRARCISNAMRAFWPAASNQMYTADEVEEFTPVTEQKPAVNMFEQEPSETVTDSGALAQDDEPIETTASDIDEWSEFIDSLDPDKTLGYLRSINFLTDDQSIDDLPQAKREKILEKKESFAKKVSEYEK